MARPLRIEYPGAVYHVTSRGNARQNIVGPDRDRTQFLAPLAHVSDRYGWLCHAYCLMDNHYHLLIETPTPNLSQGMRQLNGRYTQAYNRAHRRVGHLFQGRFTAILVEKEACLLELCRYVVLNPVRAKMVTHPRLWTWSSYRATAGETLAPSWLTTDWVLGQFGARQREAQRRYRHFVAEGRGGPRPWEQLMGQIYLGSEAFIAQHQPDRPIREIPCRQTQASRPSLRILFQRKQALSRLIHEAYRRHGYRLAEIADHLGVHYATVSRRLKAAGCMIARPDPFRGPVQAPASVEQPIVGLRDSLESLTEAARSWWTGSVQSPDGIVGVPYGSISAPTTNLFGATARSNGGNHHDLWNAGFGERGLNDEWPLMDIGAMVGQQTGSFRVDSAGLIADEERILDRDPSLSSNGHSVNAGDDTVLQLCQHATLASLTSSIMDEGVTDEADIVKNWTFIDQCPFKVSDLNIGFDSSSPSGEGTIPYFEINNVQGLTFVSLPEFSAFTRKINGLEIINPLLHLSEQGTGWQRSKNQDEPQLLQHNSSFGTPTLPPDRDLVNRSVENGQWSMVNGQLTAEQLNLLSRATVTIADLADGYLALTLGSTITLDTDAAGYGWFIDSTPWANEEFIPNSSPITDHASPWQLQAALGSAADGKIDLMTVLMHELGHVIGLGHVSSAVDGTRLMAGSIDPGLRRLPSALDLGPEQSLANGHSSTDPDNSQLNTQNSTLRIWAPYLTHYTVTSNGGQQPAPVINPAKLVQASHTPSHVGIFNSNFAITDQQSANYGWDQSGAVTIANGQAVLSEDSNVISTLSQTFTLPAGSTHLRFTLLDVNLQSNGTNRPPDAFEVALLESSTMTPLAGIVSGLTQTDALLNIQADGTIYKNSRVTLTPFSLQPSAYLVDIDLTGLAVGAGARLSFDLLGFGDRTSTIVLDNVLLTDGQPTAAPVAVNDSYTVAEGTTLTLSSVEGLLNNDSDSDTPTFGLTAFSLTAPSHGAVIVNADGSFSYVHNGSETTTDSFSYQISDGINFSNLATVSLTITPTNDAPTMAAIPAQSVEQGRTLTVQVVVTDPDDSNVSPESTSLTFSLQPHSLSGVSLDPATGLLTWAVPRTQAVGLYTLIVNVTDAGTPALSTSRSFTIDVLELTNTPPTLDPIGPKSVNEESEIRFTLHGSDTDVPAQPLTFSATGLPTGATFDVTTHEFTWIPAEDQGGTSYQVTFSVTDGEFSASEIVTITVNEVNVAPVLAPIGTKTVNEQTELRFTISATDADVPTQLLTFSASGLPTGATFDVTTHEFTWTPTEEQGPGTYNVTFSVTDGVVTTSELVAITVNEVNIAPVLNAIGPKSVNEESEPRFTISGSDVDDPAQTLVYSASGLPSGATFDAATREFVWTPTEAQGPGSYVITFSITDGVVTTSELVAITVNEVNIAPVLAPIGNKTVNEETLLQFTISGSDVDDPAQTLVYSASGLPTGATFDATTREFVWTPSEAQGPGSYVVTFNVSDGVVTASEAVMITVNEVNVAPVLAPIGAKSVNEESELRFTISGSDVDDPTQTLVYSATGLPVGASFNPTTREFVWTPTEAQGPGSYVVTFAVTDGVVTTSEAVTITVNEVNLAPVLTPIGNKTVNEESELRFTISGSDVDDPTQTLVYSASGLPSGATFDVTTREFSWTPTEAQGPGAYTVTFSVSDGVVTTSETITISVNEVNVAPILAPIGARSVNEETELRFTISGSDVDIPTQTLVYSATGLPTGATFDATTREFVWTPTEAQGPGSFVVTFSVTDGVATTSEAVTIAVNEVNVAPLLAPIGNKTINEGALLTFTASATDADAPLQPLAFSLAAGAPTGAAIDPVSGVFSWTPSDGPGASPYSVTVQVSDGVATASQSFTITVLNVAPTATLTLPTAVAGVDLTFSGVIGDVGSVDTLQVSWNFGDGSTTPFQAAARGTVTTTHQYAAAGTYTVTLAVKDNNGAQTSLSGSLIVAAHGLVTDPCDATKTALVLNGTNGSDNITVAPSGTANFQVTINGQSQIFAKPTGRLIVHGWSGSDNITITNAITTPTLLFGDTGSDNITGGAGPNVIFGGIDSGDNLTGRAGRDILIGGSGGDNLTGNGGDDLLIAGTTAYDTNLQGLCAITAEWLRTDQTYSQRVSNLLNGGGLNGTTRLNATTVFDAAAGDNLTGHAGTDWFFARTTGSSQDNAFSATGETVTAPGAPPASLRAQGGARPEDGSLSALTAQQLSPIVEEAKARWIASGLTAEQAAALSSIQFTIADLEGATIGLTAPALSGVEGPALSPAEGGHTITIDRTAAGHEWFIDPTPHDHAEFHFVKGLAQWIADGHSEAFSRMDLLTTVMHELGHVLGYDDQSTQQHRATLMTETLPTGVRRAILTDTFSSASSGHAPLTMDHSPVRSPLTAPDRRSVLDTFAGVWGSPGPGHGSGTATKSVIDWTEIDEQDARQKKAALGASPQKASWLQRFLFHLGRDEAKPHDHGIEVTLPGKKK